MRSRSLQCLVTWYEEQDLLELGQLSLQFGHPWQAVVIALHVLPDPLPTIFECLGAPCAIALFICVGITRKEPQTE